MPRRSSAPPDAALRLPGRREGKGVKSQGRRAEAVSSRPPGETPVRRQDTGETPVLPSGPQRAGSNNDYSNSDKSTRRAVFPCLLTSNSMSSSTKLFDLSGRVAVVTGGNGGIGRGIALGLAEAGAAVAVLARNEEKNRRVMSELEALGVPAVAVGVDVAVRPQLKPAFEKIEQTLGPVDILVNNAGIVTVKGILDHTPADWDQLMETNLNACFLFSKLAGQSMVKRRLGKIINITSAYAFFGSGLVPSYSASKGALTQLTKSMAIELAPFNIQVNAIAPGWIETDMTEPVKALPFYQEIIARTPASRFGSPNEIAGTAIFLASRASDFVTGATIIVDGGYAIR
jgi:2-dehydro-3-deoxy-D-gluconate 5-dehydrogenase